jgi:hypothetical protein
MTMWLNTNLLKIYISNVNQQLLWKRRAENTCTSHLITFSISSRFCCASFQLAATGSVNGIFVQIECHWIDQRTLLWNQRFLLLSYTTITSEAWGVQKRRAKAWNIMAFELNQECVYKLISHFRYLCECFLGKLFLLFLLWSSDRLKD